MTKHISRKRKRSGASEGEVSFESQESMLSGLEQLDVDNASLFDDSASESVFNRPLEKSFITGHPFTISHSFARLLLMSVPLLFV